MCVCVCVCTGVGGGVWGHCSTSIHLLQGEKKKHVAVEIASGGLKKKKSLDSRSQSAMARCSTFYNYLQTSNLHPEAHTVGLAGEIYCDRQKMKRRAHETPR